MTEHPIDHPTHTQRTVRRVTTLSPATLQNWANRHVIKLSDQNPGKSRKRMYSMLDMVRLVTMAHLTEMGISAKLASDFADEVAVPYAKRLNNLEIDAKKDGNRDRLIGQFGTATFYRQNGEWKYSAGWGVRAMAALTMAEGLSPDIVHLHVKVHQIYWFVRHRLLEIEIEDTDRIIAQAGTAPDA